jgi:hypothetical protein
MVVDPATVVSVTLARRLLSWNGDYGEAKLPLDGAGDAEWLAEGKRLLNSLRAELPATHEVIVTEPWWD